VKKIGARKVGPEMYGARKVGPEMYGARRSEIPFYSERVLGTLIDRLDPPGFFSGPCITYYYYTGNIIQIFPGEYATSLFIQCDLVYSGI